MDVTIVNPICARLAQPGHDAQVSIETSTTVALDCCLSDVQDPAKHQPSIQWEEGGWEGGPVEDGLIWGDLRWFQMKRARLMVRAHHPSHELRWALCTDHYIALKNKQKKPAQLVV